MSTKRFLFISSEKEILSISGSDLFHSTSSCFCFKLIPAIINYAKITKHIYIMQSFTLNSIQITFYTTLGSTMNLFVLCFGHLVSLNAQNNFHFSSISYFYCPKLLHALPECSKLPVSSPHHVFVELLVHPLAPLY